MSNLNQYRELWQQKRNELQVGSNAQADWSEMQDLLDQQMPVTPTDGAKPNSKIPKSGFTRFGPLSVVSGLIIAGLATYLLLHTKHANKVDKTSKPDRTEINKDSLSAITDVKSDESKSSDSSVISNNLSDNKPAAIDAAKNNNSSSSNADSKSGNDKVLTTPPDDKLKTADKISVAKNTESNTAARYKNRVHNNSTSAKSNSSRLTGNRPADPGNPLVSRQNNNRRNNTTAFSARNSDYNGGAFNQQQANSTGSYQDNSTAFESTSSLQLQWEDVVNGYKYPEVLASISVEETRILDSKNSKSAKKSSTKTSKIHGNRADIDWGLLIGANTNGSFTTKELNHNLYGTLGADPFLGIFANGNINEHWSAGIQIKALVPHMVKGGYLHKNDSKIDTGQVFRFRDLRKVYTVDVPLQAIYHITPNFNLKGGPVISIPVKQTGGASTFDKGPELDNSGYYTQVNKALNATTFSKKIQAGAIAGVGLAYKFLSLDAIYNYQFQSQKVNSALGGYAAKMNNLQITLGIQLNKAQK